MDELGDTTTTAVVLKNEIWRMGHEARDLAKRAGLLGSLEPFLVKVATVLVPPFAMETEVYLVNGLRMTIPPGFPSARTYLAGIYEPEISRFVHATLQDGMTFVDVGANIGYYTLIASHRVGLSGRVYAFEPDPRNHGYLQRNISTNNLKNVVAVQKAITSRTGPIPFVQDRHGAEGRVVETGNVDAPMVEGTTLDEFFRAEGWPSVHVVKMDIEGSERSALGGMTQLVQRNRDMVLILELNRQALARAQTTPADLAEDLANLGFRKGQIFERGMKQFTLPGEIPRSGAVHNLLLRQEPIADGQPSS